MKKWENQTSRQEIELEYQSIRKKKSLTKVTPNWVEELFVVNEVLMTKPITKKIVDLM